jgi:excinuclease ABC subunit A
MRGAGTHALPVCGERIARLTPQQIVDQCCDGGGLKFRCSPRGGTRMGEFVDMFDKLNSQGYSRVRVAGWCIR